MMRPPPSPSLLLQTSKSVQQLHQLQFLKERVTPGQSLETLVACYVAVIRRRSQLGHAISRPFLFGHSGCEYNDKTVRPGAEALDLGPVGVLHRRPFLCLYAQQRRPLPLLTDRLCARHNFGTRAVANQIFL